MRREVAWAAVLLVVAALAAPAAAAPHPGTGGIHGVIRDSATGDPVDLTGGGSIAVDVFNTATMARTVVWVAGTDDGAYNFPALAAGDYKLRFRYWDGGDNLIAYRWNANKANFDLADPIHVIGGASVAANATLKPVTGAAVSGTLTELGTGTPLASACYSVQLFEISGIGLGWVTFPEAGGGWSFPPIPAGKWKALAVYTIGSWDSDGDGTDDLFCGTSPAHLDTWYRGASGWPLTHTNLVADAATFATGRTFTVAAGVPVVAIGVAMPPAPTCRGKVPTIFGTTLADTINGTPARDIISGLAGNDTINGKAGNDLLCGDAGDDTLTGGLGDKDVAIGGTGAHDACNADTMIGCEITP
jgi:Ca2+-binding RTX toxin-like protein